MVSGDFRNHSVGYFLVGLLSHIDPDRIELIAYPTNSQEDEITERIRPSFSQWRPLYGKSDEDAARLIHDDGIHSNKWIFADYSSVDYGAVTNMSRFM